VRFRAAILMSALAWLALDNAPDVQHLPAVHLDNGASALAEDLVLGDVEDALLPAEFAEGNLHPGDGVRHDEDGRVRAGDVQVAQHARPFLRPTKHLVMELVEHEHRLGQVHVARVSELLLREHLPPGHEVRREFPVRADVAQVAVRLHELDLSVALHDAEPGFDRAAERRTDAVLDQEAGVAEVFAELDRIGACLLGQDVVHVVAVSNEGDVRGHESSYFRNRPRDPGGVWV